MARQRLSRTAAARIRWQSSAYREKLVRSLRAAKFNAGTTERRSAALKGRWQDPCYQARMLAVFRSPEYREHQAAANRGRSNWWLKGKPLSADHRMKVAAAGIGRRHSEATKAKMSIAQKSRVSSPEQRNHLRGRTLNAVTREKMSAARALRKFPFNNTRPERLVRDWLAAHEVKFLPQGRIIEVGPHRWDFLLADQKVAVEVDGCYWHGCPEHRPGQRLEQRARDADFNRRAQEVGWAVIRIWEHEANAGDFSKLACVAMGNDANRTITAEILHSAPMAHYAQNDTSAG